MHYMTHRPDRIVKHKFSVTCPDAFFMETTPSPPENETKWVDVLHLGCIEMHYVTCRSHRKQKHKFSVPCPGALFMKIAPGPLGHEK
jgi:hypothetical protein